MALPAAASGQLSARLAGLEPFVDGVIAQQIVTREVAGAVVAVVHRDRTVLLRGYGHADIAADRPVDPAQTLFRPGSVSKLLTWALLMQQVEAGRVGLDDDVGRWLDFPLSSFESEPVRVRHLLNHSSGFNEVSGIITRDPATLKPFREWMREKAPRRLWPAGTEVAYSNYGSALAGIIVEEATGLPFVEAADARLFAPLRMLSTTFREPLPPALARRMATGYRMEEGQLVAQTPEWISAIGPAGSVSTSAPDMLRFMRMLLNGGKLDGARVLKPETVRFLMADSMASAPGFSGMGNGFFV
ncbi:MAG: serine hydrolase domain-containing protein, partial [Sphingomonadaceae bacterium]